MRQVTLVERPVAADTPHTLQHCVHLGVRAQRWPGVMVGLRLGGLRLGGCQAQITHLVLSRRKAAVKGIGQIQSGVTAVPPTQAPLRLAGCRFQLGFLGSARARFPGGRALWTAGCGCGARLPAFPVQRQPHREVGAHADEGAHAQAALVLLHDFPREGEPDARVATMASRMALARLRRLFENCLQVLVADADACVHHRQLKHVGCNRGRHGDVARRSVLGGVAQQVQQHLEQMVAIAVRQRKVVRNRDPQLGVYRYRGPDERQRFTDKRLYADRLLVQDELVLSQIGAVQKGEDVGLQACAGPTGGE
mmetsp:Transcript_2553/g.6699  ORF Transcript_2553/g.6699 Transcript_2553/m.6699 type:complete len:308 (+) Transcript_2553:465-1388(+)